jgi:hypothetical protein
MPLSTLIQLHILLAMTPALAGWMLASPSHPMLARGFGVTVVHVRYIDPERYERCGQASATKRTVSASIQRFCRLFMQRVACRFVTLRPEHVVIPASIAIPPSLARAP